MKYELPHCNHADREPGQEPCFPGASGSPYGAPHATTSLHAQAPLSPCCPADPNGLLIPCGPMCYNTCSIQTHQRSAVSQHLYNETAQQPLGLFPACPGITAIGWRDATLQLFTHSPIHCRSGSSQTMWSISHFILEAFLQGDIHKNIGQRFISWVAVLHLLQTDKFPYLILRRGLGWHV